MTRFRSMFFTVIFFGLAPASAALGEMDHSGYRVDMQDVDWPYARSVRLYDPPDIALIDSKHREMSFTSALKGSDKPVILQFIYTTCPGVCPVLTAVMADAQMLLDEDATLRMWSVTIDPEYDTPERLQAYAEDFGAGSHWRLMTGRTDQIDQLRKAFGTFQDNKMDHEPLTFIWPGYGEKWMRLDGFVTAAELLAETRKFAHSGHQ